MRVNDLGEFEASICLFKVKNGSHQINNEICSKLKIKIPDVYLVNFKMIPHVVLVLPLSTLNKHVPAG